VLIVRHGQSESNPYYNDPFFFDPGLSQQGQSEAWKLKDTIERFAKEHFPPQVIFCSPLRRAIYTCNLSTQNVIAKEVPRKILPVITECVTAADDIGSLYIALQAEFPEWDWEKFNKEAYASYIPQVMLESAPWPKLVRLQELFRNNPWEEPEADYKLRIKRFEEFIGGLPHDIRDIYCYGHGDFWEALTGLHDMQNCGWVEFNLSPVDPEKIDIDSLSPQPLRPPNTQ